MCMRCGQSSSKSDSVRTESCDKRGAALQICSSIPLPSRDANVHNVRSSNRAGPLVRGMLLFDAKER